MLKPILLTLAGSSLVWHSAQVLAVCEQAMTQVDINTCYQEQYTAADTELNRVYKIIRKTLGKAERQKLVQAQRAWISFRDKNCEHQTMHSVGGSLHKANTNGCLARVTQARTLELQQIYPNLFGTPATSPAIPISAPPAIPITAPPNAVPAPSRPPATTGKPITPQPHPNQLGQQDLIGSWQTVETGYGMEVRFSTINGVNQFNSYLNGTPFEAGSWQLHNGVLTISAPNGQALYTYSKVTLDNGILTLHEQQGGVEHYRKMP